jgi:hypothetical protein
MEPAYPLGRTDNKRMRWKVFSFYSYATLSLASIINKSKSPRLHHEPLPLPPPRGKQQKLRLRHTTQNFQGGEKEKTKQKQAPKYIFRSVYRRM